MVNKTQQIINSEKKWNGTYLGYDVVSRPDLDALSREGNLFMKMTGHGYTAIKDDPYLYAWSFPRMAISCIVSSHDELNQLRICISRSESVFNQKPANCLLILGVNDKTITDEELRELNVAGFFIHVGNHVKTSIARRILVLTCPLEGFTWMIDPDDEYDVRGVIKSFDADMADSCTSYVLLIPYHESKACFDAPLWGRIVSWDMLRSYYEHYCVPTIMSEDTLVTEYLDKHYRKVKLVLEDTVYNYQVSPNCERMLSHFDDVLDKTIQQFSTYYEVAKPLDCWPVAMTFERVNRFIFDLDAAFLVTKVIFELATGRPMAQDLETEARRYIEEITVRGGTDDALFKLRFEK